MIMNRQDLERDRALSALLRESCPSPPLPPGFQQAVWRRTERAKTARAAWPWDFLARLAESFVRPRLALASLSAMLVLGIFAGAWQGQDHANTAARERYLASVAPWQGQ